MGPGRVLQQPGPQAARKTALSCWKKSNGHTDLPFISVTVEGDRDILRAVEMFGSLRCYHCDFQLSPRKWREKREERGKLLEPQAGRQHEGQGRQTLSSQPGADQDFP